MSTQRKLQPSELLSFDDTCNEILITYALASRHEWIMTKGEFWYAKGRAETMAMVAEVNTTYQAAVSTKQGIDVVAIVSPALPWELNVRDARSVIEAWLQFNDTESRKAYCMDCGVQTPYGWANHQKAWDVLSGKVEFDLKPTCYKTWNFGQCLESPNLYRGVCIDQHIVHILIADGRQGSISISAKQYKFFVKCFVHVSEMLGILPSKLQAILWTYRQFSLGYIVDGI